MSWVSEFTTQWQSFLEIVETLIRKEIKTTGQLDSNLANNIIKSEAEKWFISTHYSGAWLRKLTKRYADLGRDFRSTLEQLNLSRDIALKYSLPILPISISILCMTIIFFGLDRLYLPNNFLSIIIEWVELIKSSLFRKISLTLLIGLATFSILYQLNNLKKQRKINSLIDQIKQKLDNTGTYLSSIASKADELDSKSKKEV